MAILFYLDDGRLDWWREVFRAEAGGLEILEIDEIDDKTAIDYAFVWQPPAGELAKYPNLKVIFYLGAGVDDALNDPDWPRAIPLVRLVDDNLSARMVEYITLHCLMSLRDHSALDALQAAKQWREDIFPATAVDVRVGIMGFGVLGQACSKILCGLGFQVAGWSTHKKSVAGVTSFAGSDELPDFLEGTDILVSLLPLTEATRGILDLELFRQLRRTRPAGPGRWASQSHDQFNGPVLINAGRGGTQKESDIVAALEEGALYSAALDVFESEPLPATSPLWGHPRVRISPHCASVTDPRFAVQRLVRNIRDFEAGKGLENVVDCGRGY